MADSKRKMNTKSVTFTPLSGSPIVYTGTTTVAVEPNGSTVKFSGDDDQGPTTVVNDFRDYVVTITSADIGAVNASTPGLRGTLTWILKDAKTPAGGAGSGQMTYTVTPAIVRNDPHSAAHRGIAQGQVIFDSEWPDGVTPPLSVAVA